MGTFGKKIVEVNIDELIEKLNKALADEWLAYYQYWVGAKVVEGCMRGLVISELQEHAQDELKHAEMLADRILQLGGTPILHPQKWFDSSNCGFMAPEKFDSKTILSQNIKGEQCAIEEYKKLAEFVKGKDHITYHLIVDILKDEVEHEDDLEQIFEDMNKC